LFAPLLHLPQYQKSSAFSIVGAIATIKAEAATCDGGDFVGSYAINLCSMGSDMADCCRADQVIPSSEARGFTRSTERVEILVCARGISCLQN